MYVCSIRELELELELEFFMVHKEANLRELEFFMVHKEANFDLWDQSIHVFFVCVSFLRRGIHTLKHKVSMCE